MSKQKLKTIFVHNIFSPCSELVGFMYWTGKSMNNLLSFCGLVDMKINASDKDLPIIAVFLQHQYGPSIITSKSWSKNLSNQNKLFLLFPWQNVNWNAKMNKCLFWLNTEICWQNFWRNNWTIHNWRCRKTLLKPFYISREVSYLYLCHTKHSHLS